MMLADLPVYLNTRGALNRGGNIHLNGDELPPVPSAAAGHTLPKPACVCRQAQMPEVAACTCATSVKKCSKAILSISAAQPSSAGRQQVITSHGISMCHR